MLAEKKVDEKVRMLQNKTIGEEQLLETTSQKNFQKYTATAVINCPALFIYTIKLHVSTVCCY
jgi:hypothetical protein